MCEFCTKHGEGKKWYLEAKNYSDDLLSDLRRQKFIKEFFANFLDGFPKMLKDLERFEAAPGAIKWLAKWYLKRKFKREHHGQVVPREDIEKILDMMSTVVRIPCVCRRITRGEDKSYCVGTILSPDSIGIGGLVDESFWAGPDSSGLETIGREEAKSLIADFEKESLCHTVWTFQSPFIGGICNCDRSDCMALIGAVTYSVPVLYKAEYVAEVDWEKCNGCRACMHLCQFGAIGFSATAKKIFIDPRRCFGCGICRARCKPEAIILADRQTHPIAARSWV